MEAGDSVKDTGNVQVGRRLHRGAIYGLGLGATGWGEGSHKMREVAMHTSEPVSTREVTDSLLKSSTLPM